MLDIARDDGMPWVDLVTDVDNLGSQAVIARNGGTIVRRYVVPPVQGAFDAYQWRIAL
jgi:predicted acetyltransferase